MAISVLPTAPARSQTAATFVTNADAFVAALATFRTEANALGAQATIDAATASAAATSATTSASNAAASATAAGTSAGATAWITGTTYALNGSAISQIDFQTYRKITASSVTTTDPKNDAVNWVIVGTPVSASTLINRYSLFGGI